MKRRTPKGSGLLCGNSDSPPYQGGDERGGCPINILSQPPPNPLLNKEGKHSNIRPSPPKLRIVIFLFFLCSLCLCGVILLLSASRAKLESPRASLLLLDRYGRFLAETGSRTEEFGYWLVEPLPDRVVSATTALEDRRFWKHPGVDPAGVVRALVQNIVLRKRISGASTIAMQVARMQNPGDRTYFRKATEAITALILTHKYGREAVLAHYLRIVPYGNRIHGIAYAARRYFDKPVEDLSWAEISFLAALPQAPGRMNPFDPTGMASAVKRGRRLLDHLFEQGVLTRDEYHIAAKQLAAFKMPEAGKREVSAMHAVLHLEKMLSVSGHPSRTIVQTSLDLNLQREVSWLTSEAVHSWEKYGAGNGAVIVLDRNSSQVLAWVGSADYFDASHAGAIDYTQISRSSGSTLKPFLYGLALERGVITPATILEDLHRAAGGIGNADDQFLGPLLPRVALANSRNVPAVDLLLRTGMDEMYGFFGDLGLHGHVKPARDYGVGLAVGGLPVTLEQLVRAYSVLAREGVLADLVWYDGQSCSLSHRVFSEDTARQITLFLSDPMARLPAFPRMGSTEYAFPVAVKTGTSYSHKDAWTIAYSGKYVVAVWVGHPDYLSMNRLSGYRSAAVLAQRVLTFLQLDLTDGLRDVSFPPPRGFVPVRICALTGKLAKPECDRVTTEWFRKGQEPVEFCDAHFALAPSDVRLAPQYAAWEERNGYFSQRRKEREETKLPDSIRLQITLPENGIQIQRDPETPEALATLALEAIADPPSSQVIWYVDGAPFQTVDFPYSTRWVIEPGQHTFQIAVPFTHYKSSPVRINIQ